MTTSFNEIRYRAALAALGVGEQFLKALLACIGNRLPGFEASSRSVAMLCHSFKMAIAMKVGSKLENAAKLTFDRDLNVEGFFFKVGELAFSFTDESGKKRGVRHRPDALRLLRLPARMPSGGFVPSDHIRFAEFKSWDVLEKAINRGDRYTFDPETNRFRCPGAEKAAIDTYGFGYDILTERDFDAILVANLDFLQTYYDSRVKMVPSGLAERARQVVGLDQGISFSSLLASVPGLTPDHFYKLLVDQKLYVPLEVCQLDMSSTMQVFSDRTTCDALGGLTPPKSVERLMVRNRFPKFEPNEKITIRGKNHTVIIAGAESVQFRTEKGDSTVVTRKELEQLLRDRQISSLGVPRDGQEEGRKILLSTPPAQLTTAIRRLAVIKAVLDGDLRVQEAKKQLANYSYWMRMAKLSVKQFGNLLIGLIDGRKRQGQHGSHLSPEAEAVVSEAITNVFASSLAPKKSAAYATYRKLCKNRGVAPVSEKTFIARIKRHNADNLAKKREGIFSAAAVAAPVSEEMLLMGGGRWFMHVGHLDEFVVDLATIFPELGLPLGTAWAVVMIDTYTRTVLAIVTSFEAPSYVTTMALLHECVERWGRLPEVLFMDNGPGFKNASIVLFAEYYGVQLCWRPPGMPRWGAEVERFAGALNQRVFNELSGATKVLNRLRRVSRSHHPDTLAIYGLQNVADILREWSKTVYDNLPHGGLHGKSPAEMRTLSQAEHGARQHLNLRDDPLFPILSLPAPAGDGMAKVQAHDGVQVDNLYYWHKRFYDSEIVGTKVSVRYDPFDITKVYAFVKDEWIQCDCIKLIRLRRLSAEDLCAASLEIRKGRSDYNKRRNEVLERVDAFLDATKKKGEELAELLRKKESARQLLRRITPDKVSGDDDAGAASASATPRTPPSIPGFSVNLPLESYENYG